MNYIVMDLEWNQSPSGKYRENPKIPFEIIEIGAVKLNEKKKVIDSFSETIKPLVYRSMNRKTQDVVHIQMSDLTKSRTFSPVIRSFLEWCGEDYMFVTWGTLDLFELQRNMDYYRIQSPFPKPFMYYDLQKLYSLLNLDGKQRPSLEDAIDALQLPKERPFHRAYDDACYTADIMAALNLKSVMDYQSVDYYHLPSSHEEELYLDFKTYTKFVSMPYPSKEAALADKNIANQRCCKCGLPVFRRVRWFTTGSGNTYYSLIQCPRHGYIKGKLRIKHTLDDRIYVVKTVKQASAEDVDIIRQKKETVRQKRRDRRKKHSSSNTES